MFQQIGFEKIPYQDLDSIRAALETREMSEARRVIAGLGKTGLSYAKFLTLKILI